MMHEVCKPTPRVAVSWHSALRRTQAGDTVNYLLFHGFNRVDRIEVVKERLPATLLTTLAADMHIPRERLYGWLGIARTTANRKIKGDESLSQDESERVLGIARLIGQVQKIVGESGELDGFDAPGWTADWLAQPNLALASKTPGEFMDTADGRALVAGLVAQMQSGAYA